MSKNNINWTELGYPNMPEWLEMLVSNNQEERDLAYQNLSANNLDEPNEVSKYLIPIFIALLNEQDTPEKDGILHYLMRLASYSTTSLRSNQKDKLALSILELIQVGMPTYLKMKEFEGDIGYEAKMLLDYLSERQS